MKTRKDGDDQEGEKREADLWDKMCYEISLGLHPQCTIEEVREKVAKRLVRRG